MCIMPMIIKKIALWKKARWNFVSHVMTLAHLCTLANLTMENASFVTTIEFILLLLPYVTEAILVWSMLILLWRSPEYLVMMLMMIGNFEIKVASRLIILDECAGRALWWGVETVEISFQVNVNIIFPL